MSDDGRFAMTLIAFVGSVFSPRYARARRRGLADPMDFCAFNAVVYGPNRTYWALTEWPRTEIERTATELRIGGNRMRWSDGALNIDIDERTAPWRRHLKGVVQVRPYELFGDVINLDTAGRHRWYPTAPLARVTAQLHDPKVTFSGSGYHDANVGLEALEDGFQRWTWSRAASAQRCCVLYDATRLDGSALRFGRTFFADGSSRDLQAPRPQSLPAGRWGVFRETRTDQGGRAHVSRVFEDTPFYTRSLLNTQLGGEQVAGVHESVALNRFRAKWVQWLLPFKIRTQRTG